ncbi:MAG: glycosyl hydrolase family 28-related protein [Segetibacter sp.]
MKLPKAAGAIDVTKPPYSADPTGKRDCSEAFQKAFTAAATRNPGIYTKKERAVQIVYLPAGTYRVSKPLVFTTNQIEQKRESRASRDITLGQYISGHMMLIGESKENTRIILTDNASEFQGTPTPLLRFLERSRTNTEYFNWIMDLTIDVGKGNPAAIGAEFVSSNIGGLRNIHFICNDNMKPSAMGLDLRKGTGGLSYLHHIKIEGFQVGVQVGGYSQAM